jgi:N-acetylneuraminate synthase
MVYVIAEIGINHNGSLERALRMIEEAKKAGAWDKPKVTPWGDTTYIEYKQRMEFGLDEYVAIDKKCAVEGIDWFVSVWDIPALRFAMQFKSPFVKIPSAKITDKDLMHDFSRVTDRKKMISTGMSTKDEIFKASAYNPDIIMHTTSTYPCSYDELNLRMITTLQEWFGRFEIGYSGHETGLATSIAAVALGAKYIERHFTLDRTDWGTDQAASVEPQGLAKLVRDIRLVERALGDGKKVVYKSELPSMEKLRGRVHAITRERAV